jgi:hypothetical protein
VFAFKGPLENDTQYRFFSLVCFDWIATVHNQKAWRWVMEDLRQQASRAQAELSLSWLFIIQCNRKPSDDTFLTEVTSFFDQTTLPNVRRDRTCLVFANSAGRPEPARPTSMAAPAWCPANPFAEPKCIRPFPTGARDSVRARFSPPTTCCFGAGQIHSFCRLI